MSLRNRTLEDPPVVDFHELRARLATLASYCVGLHFDTRYLPDDPAIDEAYKVHRTLMRLDDINLAIDLARQLDAVVTRIVLSRAQVVNGPEDLAWEAERLRESR